MYVNKYIYIYEAFCDTETLSRNQPKFLNY